MATRSPAAQVAAQLAAWRPLVNEIVLGVDERGDGQVLTRCAELADEIVVLPATSIAENYLGVMHAGCSGDWILRVDDGELPSARLAAALPALLEEQTLTHFWLPRDHPYPTPETRITVAPWGGDGQIRLVRNLPGLWTFPSLLGSSIEIAGPSRVAAEPLLCVTLLLLTPEQRAARALRLAALGGGAGQAVASSASELFSPEGVTDLTLGALDSKDSAVIERFLTGARRHAEPPTPMPDLPRIPRAEVERWLEDRELTPSAHQATLRLLDRVSDGTAGSAQSVLVEITNDGDGWLPRGPDPNPPVFVAHRWFDAQGEAVASYLPRTALTETVDPGATTRLPVTITRPSASGRFELRVELVHEHVLWFGEAATQWAEITVPASGTVEPVAAGGEDERFAEALGRVLGRPVRPSEVERAARAAGEPGELLAVVCALAAEEQPAEPAVPTPNVHHPDLADFGPKPGTLSPDGAVIVGEEGWLFLVKGANAVVEQFTGRTVMAQDWLLDWSDLVQRRSQAVASLGARAAWIVAPDKLAILEHHYPEPLPRDGPRPIERLLDEAHLPLLYPRSEMIDGGASACLRTDTHFTPSGNELLHRPVCAALGLDPADAPGGPKERHLAAGDLGAHFTPPILEVMERPQGYGSARVSESNHAEVRAAGGHIGTRMVLVNPAAPDPRTLVLFGDSYGFAAPSSPGLAWWLAQCVREVHFLWVPMGWDAGYVERVGAGLVVFQTAERFLGRLPREEVDVVQLAEENVRRRRVSQLSAAFRDG